MNRRSPIKELLPPIIVSVVLVGLFISLLHNVDRRNASVVADIENKRAVVLSPGCDTSLLSEIIYNDGYAETKEDADFIASVLVERQKKKGRLPSLFTLQKRAFGQVKADTAAAEGVLPLKLKTSYDKIGQNDTVFPFEEPIHGGIGKMTVKVYKKKPSEKWWKRMMKMEDNDPCKVDTVLLTTYYRDSLNAPCPAAVGFLPTDSLGVAVFCGLDTAASYSVLPIKHGCEYGSSKGTVGGKWKMRKSGEGMVFSFEQKEHLIPLFGNATLKQIKADRTILVRSPKEFKDVAVKWFVYVMLAWWALCLYLIVRKKKFNGALVASCMFLSVLCVLMMFSMQDPLNDELNGIVMGKGVVLGLAVCLVFQSVDFVKFYQNNSKLGFDIPLNLFRWLFCPYRQKVAGLANTLKGDANVAKKIWAMILVLLSLPFLLLDLLQITRLGKAVDRLCEKLPKGIGWLVLALLLTAMLWTPFGQAIGGMKVNLKLASLVFQPSEIAKYLILFFMAAFFTQQADTIIAYSQPQRMNMMGSKLKTLLWIVLGLAVLMAMYLALGDLGPGLVIGITFILLYSLIKSKVNLEHLDEGGRWKRIFTCDFAMLIYGVLTFAGFLLLGYQLGGRLVMLLFGVLWFVFWVALGYFGFRKQLFESAMLFNMVVFVFVCGGDLMQLIPGVKDSSAVERFNDRVEMCTNTWGDLDIEHLGENAKDVSNSQVANGLWAMATGGMTGQGLGESRPSLIPAFHTDMILSSIGEQMGWIGLLMVVAALFVLLRKMAVVGYRVGHPFAFYLCLGFAIVIGVQFFIIALGSSGMIPLTGVTVPFLSFGRVSMILNLAAFGVVLSLCNNIREEETAVEENVRQKTVEQYSYPVAMVTMVFLVLAVSTLLVWQYYQLWNRDSTLIRPAYVINNQGAPEVDYNPRINLLMNNMYAGRIYDRKNRLLATGDKNEIDTASCVRAGLDKEKLMRLMTRHQRRYYPFGEYMFFMVGDQNEGIMFAYDEYHPAGYMAEAQHLSYLRDFKTAMLDESGKPVKVELNTDRLKESSYLAPRSAKLTSKLRDYSELLVYLKDGIDGKKVEEHNKKVKESNFDLHLTVDAALQVELQKQIADFIEKGEYKGKAYKDMNLLRVSAVVLDAENGDLLASANYPLPDYDRLREEEDIARRRGRPYAVYSDNLKDTKWPTYTDRDLGTTYQTPPGSTAKVMSAMGGFRKLGMVAQNQTYRITNANAIEKNKKGEVIEPTGDDVAMDVAIIKSSNCYFVNLVNEQQLFDNLKEVYSSVGINIGGIMPYCYTIKEDKGWEEKYYAKIDKNKKKAYDKYELFDKGKLVDPKDRKVKPKASTNMSVPEWKWAWGQGYSDVETGESFDFLASPLNMARVAATVVNGGEMPVTQYVMQRNDYERSLRKERTVPLMKPGEARILKGYMLKESANQKGRNGVKLPEYVGGKTGTPERGRIRSAYEKNDKIHYTYDKQINDGWYMFFVEGDATHHSIAVAVRLERLWVIDANAGAGSGAAVRLTGSKVLDCLRKYGYIRND